MSLLNREQVCVVGVGFDIACGNAAIRTDLTRALSPDLVNRLGEIADTIPDEISFGIGRKNRAFIGGRTLHRRSG